MANRFRYAGEQFDGITGQYYLRARYYDPQTDRFTQEDVYRGDGLNLYVYVGNNPVKYVDPWGYCKDDSGIGDNVMTIAPDPYAGIYDSYDFVQDLDGAPPQYAIPLTAIISIARLSDHFVGTNFNVDDGTPDYSGIIKIIQDWQKESKGVATALVKFNYIMGSDYRYLMLGSEGRGVFLDQLDKLKGKIQNQNFPAYTGAEEETYRTAIIEYINKIYDMNKNFSISNNILIEKLQQLADSVTSIDASTINEQLFK